MARASAWGLGAALAYRRMDVDEQAELLALYVAAHAKDGMEAKDLIQVAVYEPLALYLKSRQAPPSVQAPSPAGPIPDILRTRLTPETLASRS